MSNRSHKTSGSPLRPHRPQPHTTQANYTQRTSMSSDSSSSPSSSSSASSSYYADQYPTNSASSSQHSLTRVETLRCSRCAKSVETVVATARAGDNGEPNRIGTDDASASGMVRFGHNLYYCERCARMVGYQ